MFIGHPSTNLLVASRTSLHCATIATCDKGSGDHDTAVAVFDCTFGRDRVLRSPGTAETDAKLGSQSIGDESWAATSTDRDSIGDRIWMFGQGDASRYGLRILTSFHDVDIHTTDRTHDG